MLKFSFKPMFAARGVHNPTGYLRKAGFSPYTASYITTGKLMKLNLKQLERLCLLLNCTPHDLLEWEPDAGVAEPNKFELSKLMRTKRIVTLDKELSGLPLDKLEEVHRFIEEKKREV